MVIYVEKKECKFLNIGVIFFIKEDYFVIVFLFLLEWMVYYENVLVLIGKCVYLVYMN